MAGGGGGWLGAYRNESVEKEKQDPRVKRPVNLTSGAEDII
jgi:hypothetical protein